MGRHSEKPAVFYEIIERYFPTLPKIKLHARGTVARSGWEVWGLEAPIDRRELQVDPPLQTADCRVISAQDLLE